MKKKILALCLVVVLAVTAVTGATLAYFTDTDAATNTMTLGNVSIEQIEMERGENGALVNYTQDKPLYPAVNPNMDWAEEEAVDFTQIQGAAHGSQYPFVEPNAQDKFVFVKNTSTLKSDAFVRTLVAFEAGSLTMAQHDAMIGLSYHDATWTIGEQVYTTIGGKNYVVIEMVYTGRANDDDDKNGVLPAGQTTTASLCQIYLASSATNETATALDGNKNNKYDIIVLSQAVQTQGFTDPQTALNTAFGTVTEANATKWFEAIGA